MRILHISPDTPGKDAVGGGAVFSWQNIMALRQLGHEVHLAIANDAGRLPGDLHDTVESVSYCVPIAPRPWHLMERLIGRVFRPETLMFRMPEWQGIRAQVLAAAARVEPDVIWADWIGSVLLAPEGIPIVYGHLDFIYQLQQVRRQVHSGRLRRPDILGDATLEAIEKELVKRCVFALTVSSTDRPLFDSLGLTSEYVPVVGQTIPRPSFDHIVDHKPRAFLLGRTNTAMNAARRNLRDELWPELGADTSLIEWHQVGEVPTHSNELWRWMEERFVVHGYVADLSTVLRPGDLCLVPYRSDTGFRAKFVTAAAHGMVNIGYDETFSCAEEFSPGVDCLAASSASELADLIRRYARDHAWRLELSRGARALYEDRFGMSSVLPVYERALRTAAAARPHQAIAR